MFRQLGRGLALARAAFGAPLVAGKVFTGAVDFGGAPGVVGSGWVTTQWWGNDATISSGGGGEKWEGGRWGGLFIGLGVRAHADHRPESNLQPNRRFIKSLLWIGYEFDSHFLTILLVLQAFTEGIRRWWGACVVIGVR
jgi:hypothetical protein